MFIICSSNVIKTQTWLSLVITENEFPEKVLHKITELFYKIIFVLNLIIFCMHSREKMMKLKNYTSKK